MVKPDKTNVRRFQDASNPLIEIANEAAGHRGVCICVFFGVSEAAG